MDTCCGKALPSVCLLGRMMSWNNPSSKASTSRASPFNWLYFNYWLCNPHLNMNKCNFFSGVKFSYLILVFAYVLFCKAAVQAYAIADNAEWTSCALFALRFCSTLQFQMIGCSKYSIFWWGLKELWLSSASAHDSCFTMIRKRLP